MHLAVEAGDVSIPLKNDGCVVVDAVHSPFKDRPDENDAKFRRQRG